MGKVESLVLSVLVSMILGALVSNRIPFEKVSPHTGNTNWNNLHSRFVGSSGTSRACENGYDHELYGVKVASGLVRDASVLMRDTLCLAQSIFSFFLFFFFFFML